MDLLIPAGIRADSVNRGGQDELVMLWVRSRETRGGMSRVIGTDSRSLKEVVRRQVDFHAEDSFAVKYRRNDKTCLS